jgi:integrase
MSKDKKKGYSILFRAGTGGRRGRYVLSYDAGGGKWKQKVMGEEIATKADAEKWAKAFLAREQAEGRLEPQAANEEEPTLRRLFPKWKGILEQRKLKRATLQGKVSPIESWVMRSRVEGEAPLGDLPIMHITVQTLRPWLRSVRDGVTEHGKPMAAYSTRNVLNALSAFLDDVQAEGWAPLTHNPAKSPGLRVELPKMRTRHGSTKIVVPLEHARALILSDEVSIERRVKYVLAFTSGLSDGEIAGLTWADVDLDASVPFVDINKAAQVRNDAGFGEIGETKTENRIRLVPLHPAAVAALRLWKKEGWELVYTRAKPQPSDFVFIGKRKGRSVRRPEARLLRADLAKLELPTTVRGHRIEFRHTRTSFASYMNAEGHDDALVGRLMGHSGRTVTRGSYIEADMRRLALAVASLPFTWTATTATAGAATVPGFVPAAQSLPQGSRPAQGDSAGLTGRRGWDSNPRMTVLQTGSGSPRLVPSSPESADSRQVIASESNGTSDSNGTQDGPGTVPAATLSPPLRAFLRETRDLLAAGLSALEARAVETARPLPHPAPVVLPPLPPLAKAERRPNPFLTATIELDEAAS